MRQYIAEDWMPRLRSFLRERYGEERDHLSAGDFPSDQSVEIRFPDGSHVHFRFAFAIEDPSIGEVGVFTEHCGYHYFPLVDAEIELVRSDGPAGK